jgi:hypothetical protein
MIFQTKKVTGLNYALYLLLETDRLVYFLFPGLKRKAINIYPNVEHNLL